MDKKLLWWIFGVTKGGIVRARIVKLLHIRPSNANQIARELKMDYTTVRYHLDILLKHDVVEISEPTYIVMYFLTQRMMDQWEEFLKIYDTIVGGNKG
jgi:DNA-binding transcriptional ArsR family regulator